MLLAGIIGTVIGSFLNVCIWRVPRGQSVFQPPSSCPECGSRLGPLELVPVLSYLALRGRCGHCRAAISPRYPAVEAATGILFMIAYLYHPLPGEAVFHSFFVSVFVVLAAIDLEHRILPNKVIAVGLGGGLALLSLTDPGGLWPAAAGALAGGAIFLVIVLASRGGMGAGDFKMAALVGLYLGWPWVLIALMMAVFSGAFVGLALLLTGRKGRRDAIPFGPFLALGAWITGNWGTGVASWYWERVLGL